MRIFKKACIAIFTVLMMFVSLNFGGGHVLEIGKSTDAAVGEPYVGEGWTLIQQTHQYMGYDRTYCGFYFSSIPGGTDATARINSNTTGGPSNLTFMQFNNLDSSLYEYRFIITHYNGIGSYDIFWSYNVDFGTYGSSCPIFPWFGSADTEYNNYYFWFYRKLKNQVPTITSTTQGNETFSTVKTNMSVSGTVSDPDNGDVMAVKYRVDGTSGQAGTTIATITSDTAAKPFSNAINVSSYSEGIHTLYQWVEDDKGGKSPESATTFYIDKSAPTVPTPTLTANSSSQITITGNAADPLVNGIQSGLDPAPYLYNDGTDIGTWRAGAFIHSGLKPNTQYAYKYKAKDKVGNTSNYSNTASVYTLANVPNNLRVTDASVSTVSLAWDSNGNPAGTKYELYCNETGTVIYTGTNTSFTHSGRTEGTTYTYKVRAINGNSVATAYTANMTYRINSKPTSLTVSGTRTKDSIQFTWSENNNGFDTEYEAQLIRLSDNSIVNTITAVMHTVKFSFLDTNLQYMVKVRTKIYGSNYTDYVSYSAFTAADVPILSIDSASQSTINGTVGLNSNPAGTEVLIERSTTSTFDAPVTIKNWGTETTFIDTGLSPGVNYYYRVKARNQDNVETGYSSISTYRINAQPTSIMASVVNKNEITFSWDSSGNPVGTEYEVQLVKGADDTVIDTKTVTDTSTNFTGLDINMEYSVKIRTKIYSSNYTDYVSYSAFTAADVPIMSIDSASQSTINGTVGLNSNPAGTEVLIERSTTSTFDAPVTIKNWGTETTFIDTGLSPGVNYYYRVKARNHDNLETVWSTEQSLITIPAKPNSPAATAQDINNINLVWQEVPGADSYDIYRNGVLVINTTALTYIDTGLVANTQYSYTISAKNSSGDSGVSDAKLCYCRAANPTSINVTGKTQNSVSLTLVKDTANGIDPENKVEIKPIGEDTIAAQSEWSTQADITLTGLVEDTEYDVWVTTRNGDNIENLPVLMIEDLTSNNKPVVTVDNTNVTASAITLFNNVTMSGIVTDSDNELVIVNVTIDGVTKAATVNPAPSIDPETSNWSVTFDGSELSEGNYTNIEITAIDAKGGVGKAKYTGTITIDKSGPATTPIITINNTSPTIGLVTVTVDYGDAAYKEYRINNGEWQQYTGQITIEDNCLIDARGLDEYGNISEISSVTVGNIDREPPAAPTINLSDANWTAAASVSVDVMDGIDMISGVDKSQIKVGSGEWTDYTTSISVTAEGITPVSAVTIDKLGHKGPETTAQVKIDRTNPVLKRIYIENGTLYVIAQDNLGLNTTPYKFKLKSTTNVSDVETVENAADPFQLSLLIETDRNLRDQSTVWISSNYLNHAKLGDVYVIYVKDQANNTVSQQITVNKESGTLWGELTPEEQAALNNSNNSNNSSSDSSSSSSQPDPVKDITKDAEDALSEVVTIADNTPVNSGSGQISIDLSSMIKSMNNSATLANCKYKLELTEKKTGYLVYSKVLTDTKKIVIPDLDDATTYIVKVAIIDINGHEANSKSFEQSTPDRTPPIISALKTKDGVLTVDAKDNVMLAGEAYKYELVSMNINIASTDNKEIDVNAINKIKTTMDKVANNEWNLNTWTSENKLVNVEVNMVIKTIVKDAEGNTAEQIIVVDSEPKEYVNVLNPDNPYILRIDTTGDIKSYFGNGDYEYSSSDNTIATVDENGIITGHRNGEVIITAKDKKTGNVKQLLVKIKNVNIIDLRRIIVEKDSLTNLAVLYKEQLQTILGATAGITWETEDSNIAVVDNSGLLKAVNNGLTKIKATYKDKKMDVYVIVAQAGSIKSDIQEINIQAPYVIKKGANINLNQMIKCKDFKELDTKTNEFTVYEVSDETILKLGPDGSIQAIMEGAAEITVIDLVNNVFSKIKILVTDISPVKINYIDVSHHWSKKFFETEVTQSIIRGYPDNQFKPDNKVTNSEFLAMLSKTLLIKEQALKTDRSEMMYNGLNQNDPMYNYAASVLVNVRPIYSTLVFGNIMSGKETITRGEVAELLMALTQGKLERKVKNYNFKDLDGKPHEDALRYCIETGIYNGCGDNLILGQKTLTRAEMLVVMNKLSELL